MKGRKNAHCGGDNLVYYLKKLPYYKHQAIFDFFMDTFNMTKFNAKCDAVLICSKGWKVGR